MINRDSNHRNEHNSNGHAQIEMDEPHSVSKGLPGVDKKVMALACVAMMEMPMVNQFMLLSDSR